MPVQTRSQTQYLSTHVPISSTDQLKTKHVSIQTIPVSQWCGNAGQRYSARLEELLAEQLLNNDVLQELIEIMYNYNKYKKSIYKDDRHDVLCAAKTLLMLQWTD